MEPILEDTSPWQSQARNLETFSQIITDLFKLMEESLWGLKMGVSSVVSKWRTLIIFLLAAGGRNVFGSS